MVAAAKVNSTSGSENVPGALAKAAQPTQRAPKKRLNHCKSHDVLSDEVIGADPIGGSPDVTAAQNPVYGECASNLGANLGALGALGVSLARVSSVSEASAGNSKRPRNESPPRDGVASQLDELDTTLDDPTGSMETKRRRLERAVGARS